MTIKHHPPTSPGRRSRTDLVREEITKTKPEKSLTKVLLKKSGRSHGKIAVRHQGGRHKRLYRMIDFKRDKRGVPAKVLSIEYDPNRSVNIALLQYEDEEKRYILAPQGLKSHDTLLAGEEVPIQIGNAMPLKNLPLGSIIHNIELLPGKGGQLVRGAGQQAALMSREGGYAQVRLPSGEIRLIPENSYATLGQLGNPDHALVKLGKAGRKRHLGIRPTVRGTAMPAGEHPHGGGEGRTGPGRPSKTYKGKPAMGKKTRKKGKRSDKHIIKKR